MTHRARTALLTVGLMLATAGCGEESVSDGGLPDGATAPEDGGDGGTLDGSSVRMRCGDGEITGTEECDDGNRDDDDGCSADCALECGDGAVTGDEACDTGIAAGETGACPTDCDDGDACTTGTASGSDCSATCVFADITTAVDGDGCCPTGVDASADDDCSAVCGNGVVEPGETCDTGVAAGSTGACPTACDDSMDCTADALTNAGTCTAACTFTPITTPADDDACCPAGATIATDDDCGTMCGDGVVSGSETCDTSIAAGSTGACPTACDDGNVCTTDALVNAGTCTATCTTTAITAPNDTDGCCPPGETIATDADCTGTCGDGVVSGGETCDTAATGSDACPTSCDDAMACTMNVLSGAGTCSASCSFPAITAAADGDGCCPSGETIGTDDDCPTVCGDGVVSGTETCDTAASGSDACPTGCDDGEVCTADALANPGTCRAVCTAPPIAPGPMDSCCPMGSDLGDDPDCPPACGDGVLTAPEVCDDGNLTNGDGCTDMCATEPVAFRITDLDIRDPHLFATVVICVDVTNTPFGMDGVNPLIQTSIQGDSEPDGELDLSLAQVFEPFLQAPGTTSPSDLVFPDCTAPMSSTMCTLPMGATTTPADAMNMGPGTVCLDTLPGTFRASYTPSIVTPTAPAGGSCYVADAGTITFDLSGIAITLEDTLIGGVWSGTDNIVNGLIRGFLPESVADATIIPDGLTGFGGIDNQPLSSLLRGGTDNCREGRTETGDRDVNGGVDGWWFYLSFSATRVPYTAL